MGKTAVETFGILLKRVYCCCKVGRVGHLNMSRCKGINEELEFLALLCCLHFSLIFSHCSADIAALSAS